MQISISRHSSMSACVPLPIVRGPCKCRSVIQRRSWRPVIIRAASGHHQQAVDRQAGQHVPSAEMVPEYPSPSHTQQQAYQQHYGVPQYPGPPPQYDRKGSSGGGLPNVLWVLIGVVIATVVSKVYGVVSSPGGIQGWMMQQAMKAAMKGMGQPGQPGQAPNPFGAGGMPAGFPGMPPNMGAQMGQGWPPAVDTTARPVGQQQSQPAASSPQPPFNQNVNAGKRFQEHKAQQAKKPPSAASQRNTASSAPAASTPPPSSFVDPPKKAASFTDVGDDDGTSSSYAASGTGPVSAQGSFADNQFAGAGFGQQQQQQASSSGSSGEGGKNKMVDMMERMLKDPNMQKMLYPHLPEGMRNPATIEWMMSNPEYRAQLEATLSNQVTYYAVLATIRPRTQLPASYIAVFDPSTQGVLI